MLLKFEYFSKNSNIPIQKLPKGSNVTGGKRVGCDIPQSWLHAAFACNPSYAVFPSAALRGNYLNNPDLYFLT